MTTPTQGYTHISLRTGQRHTAPGRNQRGTAPRPTPSPPAMPDSQQGATETEARGFVVYVGMEEAAATAAGTSLTRLATELRHYVESVVPGSQTAAAVAIVQTGITGSDLEVVRQALGDPTAPPGARPELVQAPIETPTGRQGILIDLPGREVHLDGESLNLTHKEFGLLDHLVEHGERTVSRPELIHALWSHAEEAPHERMIDSHIRRLRTKLNRLAGAVCTVRGQGYRFSEHPDVMVWPALEYSI
jgi:hypothetical protein